MTSVKLINHSSSTADWNESCIQLGGSKVCAKHFQNLIYEDLRKTFCPDGEHDEFLDIYHKIYDMCEA